MQPQIPDDLSQEVARLAAGLNLPVEVVVREAIEEWVDRMHQNQGRLPDPPLVDDMISAPCDLPHSDAHIIPTKRVASRTPSDIGIH